MVITFRFDWWSHIPLSIKLTTGSNMSTFNTLTNIIQSVVIIGLDGRNKLKISLKITCKTICTKAKCNYLQKTFWHKYFDQLVLTSMCQLKTFICKMQIHLHQPKLENKPRKAFLKWGFLEICTILGVLSHKAKRNYIR